MNNVIKTKVSTAKTIWTANQSGMQGNVITDADQLCAAEVTQKWLR